MITGFLKSVISRYPYAPMFLFVVTPAILVVLFYTLSPPGPLVAALFGAALLLLFVYYVLNIRQEDTASLGSAIPNFIGPLIAFLYIDGIESPLRETVHNGGEVLVQLAFAFASLFGLFVYLIIKAGQNTDSSAAHGRRSIQVGIFVLFFVCVLMMVYGKRFAPLHADPGPVVYGGLRGPALTPLTGVRMFLGFYAVFLAALPKDKVLLENRN